MYFMMAQKVIYAIGIVMASEAGKGSKPRPILDREKFEAEFDRIFRKEKEFDNVVTNGELLDELKESEKNNG